MPLTSYKSKMALASISRPYPGAPGFLFEWKHQTCGSAYVAYRGLPHPPHIWMQALETGRAPVLPQCVLWRDVYFCYMSESEDFHMPAVALRAALELTILHIETHGVPDDSGHSLPVMTAEELAEKLGAPALALTGM